MVDGNDGLPVEKVGPEILDGEYEEGLELPMEELGLDELVDGLD